MRVRLSSNYTKQLFATMFAVACILLGVCIGSDDAKQVYAAEVTTIAHASGKFVYATYADKEEVKNCLGKVTPGTKEGYLFAGWYTDEDCTQTIKNAKEVDEATTSIFYAKYVPENVLSTKVQISLDDINTTDEYDTRNMRFVSSVDDLTYGQVGFALKYQEKGSTIWRTFKNEGTYVFSRIVAAAGNDDYKFSPKVVDTKSEYFITATWKGADHNGLTNDTSEGALTDFNTGYYVRAYWVTMDGVTVYGPVRYVSVNDGLNTNIINVAVKGATTESGSVEVSGYDGATGTVAYHDGTYSHVRINLGTGVDRSVALKSVTKFTVDGKDVYYRNLYTKYTGTGTEDKSWYSVYGANAGEYVIATSADLYGLTTLTKGKEYYFENQTVYVIADIEVNKGTATPTGWSAGEGGTAYPWTPIIEFNGDFDGQGHTISGIQVQSNAAYCGFFGYTNRGKNSEIKNFRLENSFFGQSAGNGLGSIVGWGEGGTIQNVYSNAYVYKTGGTYSGGIAGLNYYSPMTIKNCCYEGILTTTISGAGGILGDSYSSTADIIDCKFLGSIKTSAAYAQSGGIVGLNRTTLTITSCESSGSIDSTGIITGGLVGDSYGTTSSTTITDSLFTGTITFTPASDDLNVATGGLIGRNQGATSSINTSLNTGKIEYKKEGEEFTVRGVGRVVGFNSKDGKDLIINKVYFTKEGYKSNNQGLYEDGLTTTALCWGVEKGEFLGRAAYFGTSLNFGENGSWALVKDGTPVLKAFTEEALPLPEVPEDVNIDWYTGVENATYILCESTSDNAENVKELYGLAYLVSEGVTFDGRTVNLGADVVLNADAPTTNEDWATYIEEQNPTEWKAIGTNAYEFAGIFDGGMHSIKGIYMDNNTYGTGFFRSTASGSTIKNLKIENSYFRAKTNDNYAYVGSVVANCAGNLQNIYSNAVVNSAGHYAGGIAGHLWDSHSTSSARIVISNCWFDGEVNVTGKNNGGGIVGAVTNGYWTVQNCLNTGNINLSGSCTWIGGIGGRLTDSKQRWNGTDAASDPLGALVMENCLNVGLITWTTEPERTGSVFGQVTTSIRTVNVYATNESYATGLGVESTYATVTMIPQADITGEKALEKFAPLTAEDTAWEVSEGSTPTLKIFNN